MGNSLKQLYLKAEAQGGVDLLEAQTVDPMLAIAVIGGFVFALAVGVYCLSRICRRCRERKQREALAGEDGGDEAAH